MRGAISLSDFGLLAEKYRRLAELRERRDEVEGEGRRSFAPDEAARRRHAFRILARRFPSCLSELDLPASELRRREALARRVQRKEAAFEEVVWARSMLWLHLALRILLAARRWLRRGGTREDFLGWSLRYEERARRRGLEGPGASDWARMLGLPPEALFDWICQPPEGRWRPHLERALGLRGDQ